MFQLFTILFKKAMKIISKFTRNVHLMSILQYYTGKKSSYKSIIYTRAFLDQNVFCINKKKYEIFKFCMRIKQKFIDLALHDQTISYVEFFIIKIYHMYVVQTYQCEHILQAIIMYTILNGVHL